MLMIPVIFGGLLFIAGITLLILGIVMLCRKNEQVGMQKSNTGGILLTVFGGILTFISIIVILGVMVVGASGI